MSDWQNRTYMLLGEEGISRLQNAHVAVFGVGGVGSYAFEALLRGGVGHIDVFDSDVYTETNLNRQLYATRKTLGRSKAEVARERAAEICPETKVDAYQVFYLPENADDFDLSCYSVIIDAIDTVQAKLELIARAQKAGVKILSAMGAGNKLHPEMLEIADLSKTSVCPLARVMRYELKKRGIEHLTVVYSKEKPCVPLATDEVSGKRQIPGSLSFVPSVAGLLLAGEAIRFLCGIE